MKIGLLVGREQSFPNAFIERINSMDAGLTADYIKLGGIKTIDPCDYRIIIDRISHEIPFYRAFLKQAVLNGVIVINNPFWWSADDKYFGTALVERLGIPVPKTVLLPQKEYKDGVVNESLRNLEYPLDWQGILDYVGLPAIMKPYDGGGWKNVYRIDSLDELLWHYDQTGQLCMMLQEFIQFEKFVRCYTIGRKKVLVMKYDPTKPYLQGQYAPIDDYIDEALHDRIVQYCIRLNEALGYDINTQEFAIRDGVPYAIDFTNPAPDADFFSVGEKHYNWFMDAVTELVIEYAHHGQPTVKAHRWSELLDASVIVC
jgi:glutathione synthase/RimK-type ligase-like ATP-grasp enzyme